MQKLRILHFADLVNRHDFIDNVVRTANPALFEMSVCTMGQPSNIEDPAYAGIGIPHWEIFATTRSNYPSAAIRLAALVRREKIDIVHAHHYEPCAIAAAALLLRPATCLVIGRHYSDAIYLHTVGWRRRVMLGVEHVVNHRAAAIIAPSARIASLLVDRQGVPARKVVVIPYGFDPAKYESVRAEAVSAHRRALGLDDHFSVATFGRLYSDKGHRYVLDALPTVVRAVPNLKYLIVGEGAERATLERQVRNLGLEDTVTFLGWRRDVPELMTAVDVVVQPSLQEALSQSMAEALFLGRPLIISDVSGSDELVPDDSMGTVVPCRDAGAIAAALVGFASDPQRRATVGKAGLHHARASLTMAQVVPLYEATYQVMAESGRIGPRRYVARAHAPR